MRTIKTIDLVDTSCRYTRKFRLNNGTKIFLALFSIRISFVDVHTAQHETIKPL
ncbi:hypothetical protein Plhal304r1_c012g0047831 [Plasmopara halstedii]